MALSETEISYLGKLLSIKELKEILKHGVPLTLDAPAITDPAMYIFINKGLGMSSGKMAAQAAHAAVEAYRVSDSRYIHAWRLGGHYKKLVMEARNAEHLKTIEKYLSERGFKTVPIIDEGRTELDPHVFTALGVEIVDKEDPHTLLTFNMFRLYKDTVKITLELEK